MQAEYTYFVVFVLIAASLILVMLRMFRSAKNTIRQLKYESRRDQKQYERIEREKRLQRRALRRGTRRINGKANRVHWDTSDRRARRDFHLDEAADEVFDPVADLRGRDVRTPWGWPQRDMVGGRPAYRRRSTAKSGFATAVADFFKTREVVDEAYIARRKQAIRAMVEDRYGRASMSSHTPDFEWSRPVLPRAYLEERARDQMTVKKLAEGVEAEVAKFSALRLVSDNEKPEERRMASGK